jgi:peroxin-1
MSAPHPIGRTIHLQPLSPDDWEVLHLNAEMAESQILNQAAFLKSGMVLPIWIQNAPICLKVGMIFSKLMK